MDIIEAVDRLADSRLQERIRGAIGVAQRTLELFGASAVAFSFNGGKDSTVVLHILRAAAALHDRAEQNAEAHWGNGSAHPGRASSLGESRAFIFEGCEDFPEILGFVSEMDRKYGLRLEELGGDFRSGLTDFIARTGVKAILLGTRRGDPNALGQEVFCPSSPGWPPFMRVNPILDWSYADVWGFLRAVQVPYCALYDQGYTSLGKRCSTFPNSSLRKEDGSFAPAYMLADGREERAGRETGMQRSDSQTGGLTRRAAVVIVGDEILAAKVEDLNSRWLCRELRALGWRVCKVTVVPDEVRAIATEVRAASDSAEVVVTCGGVGPTLDDVTMAGVADAFGYHVTRHPTLEQRLRAYFGDHITKAHLKMADVPSGEVAWLDGAGEDGAESPFPVVSCRNVYMLPGIPSLMQRKWEVVKAELQRQGGLLPFASIAFRLAMSDETLVAALLEEVAAGHDGRVTFGSYPVSGQADGAGLVLALESKDQEELHRAASEIRQRLPADALVGEETNSDTYTKAKKVGVVQTSIRTCNVGVACTDLETELES